MLRLAAVALALAAPVAFIAAAPAHAADVKTLRCVEDGMDAAGRKLLLDDLRANLENSGGEQHYRPESIAAIQKAAKACQAKYGWSDAAMQAAILYTMPKLGWPMAVEMGKSRGVNAAAIAKRVAALTPEQKAAGLTEDVLTQLASASISSGELNETNAAFGGALYGLLLLKEKSYVDFLAA